LHIPQKGDGLRVMEDENKTSKANEQGKCIWGRGTHRASSALKICATYPLGVLFQNKWGRKAGGMAIMVYLEKGC